MQGIWYDYKDLLDNFKLVKNCNGANKCKRIEICDKKLVVKLRLLKNRVREVNQ